MNEEGRKVELKIRENFPFDFNLWKDFFQSELEITLGNFNGKYDENDSIMKSSSFNSF